MSLNSFHLRVASLSRTSKRLILVASDLVALATSLWSAYALRFSDWWPEPYLSASWSLFLFVPAFGVLVFVKLGLYRAVIRFMNVRVLQAIGLGVLLTIAGSYTFVQLFQIPNIPRSIPIIFGLSAWLYLGGSRLLVRSYYHWLLAKVSNRSRVIIYGAGGAGAQLALLLQGGAEYVPVAFVDDDRHLWRGQVSGLPVFSPKHIQVLIDDKSVDMVLLALPGISDHRRKEILEYLSEFEVHVKSMPSMPEIIAGESIDALREVEIDELLGRDEIAPSQDLIDASVRGKVVFVTGAGGSIGSELARQAALGGAKVLLLYDNSEFALYEIDSQLRILCQEKNKACNVVPILGSVLDVKRLKYALSFYLVDTFYHAAAYKHVPLVEQNVLQGISNNVLGTKIAVEAAKNNGVQRFVLISTDKAVRPTSVMGATKRLAELIVQSIANSGNPKTTFCMVRFGNVLGSSGSVVPLFKKQIAQGGPVTVTHPEINRFFMTIPEAASLVIQAGSMAKGGDLFVLDMGKPVKIADLAKQMIRLSGRSVRNEENLDGDIEIRFTGLRPGEKLYEELLIGNNVSGTKHPKVLTADEEFLPLDLISHVIEYLEKTIEDNDSHTARQILMESVADFNPSSPNVDLLSFGQNINTSDSKVTHIHKDILSK